MVKRTQVLLVSRRAVVAGALGGLLTGCRDPRPAEATVDPRDYDAFFLWAGVSAPEYLGRARSVYLLAGEVRSRGGFVPLRAVPRVAGPEIWMVVRVERLDWDEGMFSTVLHTLDRWAAAGNRVAGLQVDFDAATRGLDRYGQFLAALRSHLAPRWKLSITGLLDWSAGGDERALAGLAAVVDEVVVQTYQGRHTIPGYAAYFGSLRRLGIPYRIGIVEGGEWTAPPDIAGDPRFRGCVVFLINR